MNGSISDYDACPSWEFGQVLQHTEYPDAKVMFLYWTYAVDYNWHESTFVGTWLTAGEQMGPIGSTIEPYCGWWRPVEEP